MKANNFFVLVFLMVLIFSAGCATEEVDNQVEYNKCVSVCASVLEEDFVIMDLCRQECNEKFLEER
tara:strand:- start:3281 stop:3478 length:198 start_codon:yes stop_codon:yes gene_type:complete